ncbi:MAG: indolepyruvate ferredoxin oxidoreductase subunit alpha [Oscillospiraceae bacterium]|nr:indolepyruvate ferredoxin oxidoreductase subunit alpha [Oscillospiraceae bacterium]
MKKMILTGDEAVARGAWEAGCKVAAAYPGTPSTEILENIALYKDDIYSQWACNEKVAVEIVCGASIGGARALAAMKHVGLNVAADPLFTESYVGVTGGVVIVTSDDPGCHSSQNEQDNRHYAVAAKMPMLEPSDSAECKDFTKIAYEISEEFDTPVLLRMTTRICHSKGIVELGEREEIPIVPYKRRADKYVMLPAYARVRHANKERRLAEMEDYSNKCHMNRIIGDEGAKIGVISSGISYQYAREVFDEKFGDKVKYLKLGFTNPMPRDMIKYFASDCDEVYIVEEGDGFIQAAVERLGIKCIGKQKITPLGELNSEIVRRSFFGEGPAEGYKTDVQAPPRPPVLCAGCPHRGFFHALKKHKKDIVVFGDIGCYTLGCNSPLDGFDTTICMGAGFSAALGASRAFEMAGDGRKLFGLMGDSTFFHSGITGLIDIIHSKANVCACILDNSITAMTGHQENPGTERDLMGNEVPAMSIDKIVLATGLNPEHFVVVDPVDQKGMDAAVKAAVAVKGPFVIIARRPCALLKEFIAANKGIHCEVNKEKCVGCTACMSIACPAMAMKDGKAEIVDPDSCTGCTLCAQLCPKGAIERVGV